MNAIRKLTKWLKYLFVKDYIVINGIRWDKEDMCVNGQVFFTPEEARQAAASMGKRLPTEEERKALTDLGYTKDYKRNGVWFAGNHSTNHKGSIFFPAPIRLNCVQGRLYHSTTYPYVWSVTPDESIDWNRYYGYGLAYMHYGRLGFGYRVRCVQTVEPAKRPVPMHKITEKPGIIQSKSYRINIEESINAYSNE